MKKILVGIVTVFFVTSIILCAVGCANETVPPHEHTFADSWSTNVTHHWKVATCEHTEEVSKFGEHSFGEYVSNNDATTEEDGTKTRVCSVCGYEDTVKDEGSKIHVHTFATEWTSDAENHWHAATCEHTSEVSEKAKHTFGEYVSNKDATTEADGTKTRVCNVCKYEDTVEDEGSKIHEHTFATEWTSDAENHWHAATCEHTSEVSENAEHSFSTWTVINEPTEEVAGSKERICSVCNYNEVTEIEKIPKNFLFVAAGRFLMGSEEGQSYNKPVHKVSITKDFYMGKYEIKQSEYEEYCNYGDGLPDEYWGKGRSYPAYYISWYDTLVYCNRRSIAEGLTPCYTINGSTEPDKWGTVPTSNDSTWDAVVCNWNANGYRLPTEAEWEYAARAGNNTVDILTYSGTNDPNKLGDYAWYDDNSDAKAHVVGTKSANAYGLYDMSGNVKEWCWNWWTDSYDITTEGGDDPTGATTGSYHVSIGGDDHRDTSLACYRILRGGCMNYYEYCSVSIRDYDFPYWRNRVTGFRVVRACSE